LSIPTDKAPFYGARKSQEKHVKVVPHACNVPVEVPQAAMFNTPIDEFGDNADLGTVQGLKLIRNFRRIEDADIREMILRLVERLAPKDCNA
jgi:hypothetical protein